jgi:phenylacetic acid degradation operon negative regulatory protein
MPLRPNANAVVAALLRHNQLRARSLIITLFGDAVAPHGARVWMGSLIRMLGPFGINEGMARTAVLRLSRENWLKARAVGKRSEYSLTQTGLRQFQPAARHIYSIDQPSWDGHWRVVIALPGKWTVRERRYLRIGLAWQGFGKLGDGVFLHPSTSLEDALDALPNEDLPRLRGKLLALRGDPPPGAGAGADARALVRQAWDLNGLSREYSRFVRRYSSLDGTLAERATPPQAFTLRTHLIHEYRRLLLRDPELPDELLPADWQGRKAHSLAASIYRKLAPSSEAHLASELLTADGKHPSAKPEFLARFGGLTPTRE